MSDSSKRIKKIARIYIICIIIFTIKRVNVLYVYIDDGCHCSGIAIAIARTHNLGWRDSSEAFEFDKYIIIYRIL